MTKKKHAKTKRIKMNKRKYIFKNKKKMEKIERKLKEIQEEIKGKMNENRMRISRHLYFIKNKIWMEGRKERKKQGRTLDELSKPYLLNKLITNSWMVFYIKIKAHTWIATLYIDLISSWKSNFGWYTWCFFVSTSLSSFSEFYFLKLLTALIIFWLC